jgi:hypothetical protein
VTPVSMSKSIISITIGCATIFLVAFLTLGFGWLASAGAAVVGAASSYSVFCRAFKRRGPADQGNTSPAAARFDHTASRGSLAVTHLAPPRSAGFFARLLFVFDNTLRPLPRYQRLASVVFLLQSAVSLAAIFVFCAVQASGFDARFLQLPSFAAQFSSAYPIDPGATFAKTRFDNLFVPLVLLYVISLSCFAVALIHSLVPLLRDFWKYARLLGTMVFFLIALWLLLFVGGPVGGRSPQRFITDGDALGYLVLFVFFPMLWAFLVTGLPAERSR